MQSSKINLGSDKVGEVWKLLALEPYWHDVESTRGGKKPKKTTRNAAINSINRHGGGVNRSISNRCDDGYVHSSNNGYNNNYIYYTNNAAMNAANGYGDGYAHFSNNGYNNGYVYNTSNDCNESYASSSTNSYACSTNNSYACSTNNGYNNGYAYPINNKFVSNASNKVYLPFVDSSIISMVPPPSFIKGTGKFAIPAVASKNAGVAQTKASPRTISRSGKLKRLNEASAPRVVNSTSVEKSASDVEKKVDIMSYVNNNYHYKQLMGKDKMSIMGTLRQSRYLKEVMTNELKYLSRTLREGTDEDMPEVVNEKNASPHENMEEDVSEEDEKTNGMYGVVNSVVSNILEEDIEMKALSTTIDEPVVDEEPESVEDLPESSDEKSVSEEPKKKSIPAFMKGAEEAFGSLPAVLCEFYRTASIAEIKQHLDEEWKFNLRCQCCGETPLHVAVRSRSELLNILSSGAKIDLPNESGKTALHVACEMKLVDMVVYLIYLGADPLKKNEKGETCLQMCQRKQYTKIEKIILRAMEVYSTKKFSEDHMIVAVQGRSTDLVELLLEFKPNINYVDKDGNSAISLAVQLGLWDILSLLLKQKPDLEQTYTKEGNSLLHIACKYNQPVSVKMLLSSGASVHAVNCFGETPLHMATNFSSIRIIQMLVTSNSDINAEDSCKRTPLYQAIVQNETAAVNYLLSKGASTKSFVALLINAVRKKQYSMVKLLISHGREHIDQWNHICQILFDEAVKHSDVDLISLCSDSKSRRDL